MKKMLFVTMLIILSISASNAQNWLIVDQGNPDGYQTIHDAVTAAVSGDTIFVTPGEYLFDASLGPVTISKKLAIMGAGYDADGTILTDQTGDGMFILDGSSDYSSISSFRMKGSGNHISVQTGAKNITLEKNYFIETGSINTYAVVFSSTEDDTIRYNYFFSSTSGNGLTVSSTKGQVINNNVFAGNAAGLSIGSSDANDRVLAINNIFIQCGGVYNYGSTARYGLSVNSVAEIYSNIFMNNSYAISASGDPILKYNTFYNNSNAASAGYFILSDDPLFTDYSAGDGFQETSIDDEEFDFNLQSTSPAIDAGILGYYFDVDGSRNDMGIYGGPWPMPGGKGEPTIPVVTSISVTPSSVSPSGTITISATGRIGEESSAKSSKSMTITDNPKTTTSTPMTQPNSARKRKR